jgi:hypothetical protein
MRPKVFLAILATPAAWIVGLMFFGFLFPGAADKAYENVPLNLGAWLGTGMILLSPLSQKNRDDFRKDFDAAYRSFMRSS